MKNNSSLKVISANSYSIETNLFIARERCLQNKKTLIVVKDNKELKYLTSIANNIFDLNQVISFNHWQTLAYDNISPSLKIIHQRIDALYRIIQNSYSVILTTFEALVTPVCSKKFITTNVMNWKKNEAIDLENQLKLFEKNGYQRVNQVYGVGQFALRGSIVDIFLVGSTNPFRIDFFDNEIESIRIFDAGTQKTIEHLAEIKIYPAREFNLNSNSLTIFKKRYFEMTAKSVPVTLAKKIENGEYVAGLENYLPLFSDKTNYLFDYLVASSSETSNKTGYLIAANLTKKLKSLSSEINLRYQYLLNNDTHSIQNLLKPNQFYLTSEEVYQKLNNLSPVSTKTNSNIDFYKIPKELNQQNNRNFELIKEIINLNYQIIFTVNSASKAAKMNDLLVSQSISSKIYPNLSEFIKSAKPVGILLSHLEKSIAYQNNSEKIAIISEFDYYQTNFNPAILDESFAEIGTFSKYKIDPLENHFELVVGCCVVHEEYGIGQYLGLEKINISGTSEQEYLKILYANNSKVMIPVSDISLIGRYKSSDEGVVLSQIGSKKWQTKKKKITYQIKEMAIELLASQAKRLISKKTPFTIADDYQKFAESFVYQETPDQAKAIEDVLNDLKTDRPMNRLISGDVGFGKTEVAMRATFVCVNSGKQVIILTPTTLLNQQHYQSFLNRFSQYPFNIAQISRLLTEKQNRTTLENLKNGQIDILIATHKILAKTIESKNLGLMVIDEEHRFGVGQKEKIKKLKTNLDVLTMTATPIPRTLNMAMNRLQDISIIASPPADRLSCKTVITEWDDDLLKQACLREIHRAGQIYWVHNNIKTIYRIKKIISELVPKARIAIAHGQMNKDQIDQVMYHFYHQNIDILLCTTIIETGIDIANANTIIINKANILGLSQLYQLRGRVGRSHQQAYAYLITKSPSLLKKDAKLRLEAMKKANYLGAGFELASYDLEIRGSGDFLGKMQSGNIQGIGLDLYQKLLNKTLKAIDKGEDFDFNSLAEKIEINLDIDAYLPENYLYDIYLRLVFYKKISDANNEKELIKINKELLDRFGILPKPARNLLDLQQLKIKSAELGINKVSGSIQFELSKDHQFEVEKIISWIQTNQNIYKLNPKGIECVFSYNKANSKAKTILQTALEHLNTFEENFKS